MVLTLLYYLSLRMGQAVTGQGNDWWSENMRVNAMEGRTKKSPTTFVGGSHRRKQASTRELSLSL